MKHLRYFKENIDYSVIEYDLEEIVDAYFECALWTSDNDEELKDKTISDISDESRKEAKLEIEWFVNAAGHALDGIEFESIGHDIWFTRNGHGVGFWDRGYDDDSEEILVELSKILGSADIYVGDDDLVYITGSSRYKEINPDQFKLDLEIKKNSKKYNL